jgi:nucleotide-binding universal stress UspA family protein
MRRAGVTGEAAILDGSAAPAVVREAEASGAELVVVASHGRTGLKRLLLGSVAEKVTRSAPCSVLVVRSSA